MEGWSGTENEESRLAKDTDVRIDPGHFLKALEVADELLANNTWYTKKIGRREVVLP